MTISKFFLTVLVFGVASLQAVFNCESTDANIDLTDSTAMLNLSTDIAGFVGTLSLRDDTTTLASATGNKIAFTDGTLSTGDSSLSGFVNPIELMGSCDVNSADQIILNDGAVLDCSSSGTIYQAIQVGDGTNATVAKIVGRPVFKQNIVVKNNAQLQICMENQLNRDIIVEPTGSVKLLTSLCLDDRVVIRDSTGTGTAKIFLNDQTLEFGAGTTFSSTGGLVFDCATTEKGIVSLRGNIKVLGTWYFTSGALLDGRGHFIDWSSFAGSTSRPLYAKLWSGAATEINASNLGIYAPASGLWENDSGEQFDFIMRADCKIHLAANYTLTAPSTINIYSRKERNRFVVGSYTMNFSTNCNLIVEYVPLFYDTVDQPDATNITGNISYLYTPNPILQHVKSILNDTRTIEEISTLNFSAALVALTENHSLTQTSVINFQNATPATPKAMTLDGGGYAIDFPSISGNYFHLDSNVQLTLQNVTLKNFNPACVDYGAASSSITFGDNVCVDLKQDLTVATTDKPWVCTGNVEVNGHGNRIAFQGANQLQLNGNNKTVTIRNAELLFWQPNAISVAYDTATLQLQDTVFYLSRDGCVMPGGSLNIASRVVLHGIDTSFWQSPTTAQLTTRLQNLGFGVLAANANASLYSLGCCDIGSIGDNNIFADNNTFSAVMVNKQGKAYYTTGNNPHSPTLVEIPGGNYKSISVGCDGQIWAITTDNAPYRVARGTPPTLTAAAGITADYVSVGNKDNVYALDSASGNVFVNTNPAATTPGSWNTISSLTGVKSIAAGADGTLWYVDFYGALKKYKNGIITTVFADANRNFVKVAVGGHNATNHIALLESLDAGGRVLLSSSGSPFRDLGLLKAIDVGVGVNGTLLCTFNTSLIAENATTGAYVYQRYNYDGFLVSCLDRTLTFSSSGNITIGSGTTLQIENNANLDIKGNPSGTETVYDSRKHLVFTDKSSYLNLIGGNLTATANGVILSKGNFIADKVSCLQTNANQGTGITISSAMNFNVKDNAELNIFGSVTYDAADNLVAPTSQVGLVAQNFATSYTTIELLDTHTALEKKGFAPVGRSGTSNLYGWTNRSLYCSRVFGVINAPYLSNIYPMRIIRQASGYSGINFLYMNDLDKTLMQFSNYLSLASARDLDFGPDGNWAAVSYDNATYTAGVLLGNNFGSNDFSNLGLSGVDGAMSIAIGNINNLYALKGDGSVLQWSAGTTWNATALGTDSGARSIAAGDDGTLWFVNQYGDLKVKHPTTGAITNFPGGQGLDLRRINAHGSFDDFSMVAIDKNGKLYSAYTGKALTMEDGVDKALYCSVAKDGLCGVTFSIDSTDQDQVNYGGYIYLGYIAGKRPTDWLYPKAPQSEAGLAAAYIPDLTTIQKLNPEWNAAKIKGFVPISTADGSDNSETLDNYAAQVWPNRMVNCNAKIAMVSGLSSGPATCIYALGRDIGYLKKLNLSAIDQSIISSLYIFVENTLSWVREISVGTDGTAACINYAVDQKDFSWYPGGVYRLNGVNGTTFTNLGLSGTTGAVQVSAGSAQQIYALKADGSVVKWSSGTTWNAISLGTNIGARFVAAGEDGTLWFINNLGDLKMRDTLSGEISDVRGGSNLNLCRLSVAGSKNDFCLVAVDKSGRFFSAHSARALAYEGFTQVLDCAVAKNGQCCVTFAANQYDWLQEIYGGMTCVGWITDKKPADWPYP